MSDMRMRKRIGRRLALAAAALMWVVGCGGELVGRDSVPANESRAGTPAPPSQTPPGQIAANPTAAVVGGFPIPAPSQLRQQLHQAKSTSSVDTRDASDFLPEFNQRVTPEYSYAIFSPDWADNHSPFSTFAYAIYEFELPGWSGQLTLHTDWPTAPKDYGKLWLGVSNWEKDRWDWYNGAPRGDPALRADAMELYKDVHSRETYVAVVLLGQGGSSLLKQVWISGMSRRGDWWMQGRDAQHSSCSRFAGPDSPALRWQLELGVYCLNQDDNGNDLYYDNRHPAVHGADGTIYLITGLYNDEEAGSWMVGPLFSLTPDGSVQLARTVDINGGDNWTSPAFDSDGSMYFTRWCSCLYAVDCMDFDREKWMFQGHHVIESPPAIGPDGVIYVTGLINLDYDNYEEEDRYLYALDSEGVEQWQHYFGLVTVTGPAVAPDGTVYVGSWDKQLYAFDPSGSIKWTYEAGAGIGTTTRFVVVDPSIGKDGTVYFETKEPRLYAVSPAGDLVWSVPLAAQAQGTASIAKDGALCVNCADGKLYVFNPDGTPRWSYNTGLSMSAPALDANGTVYVGSDDTHLYAISADGSLKWTFAASDTIQAQPTISEDGSLCFLDIQGWFYCLGPGEG